MSMNIHWLVDAAEAAERAFNSHPSVLVELVIQTRGVEVRGRARGYEKRHMVPWSDLGQMKFNPLRPAIDVTVGAVQRALAATEVSRETSTPADTRKSPLAPGLY